MPYTIDEYTTIRTLGTGAYGKVKLAAKADGSTVAIKVFINTFNDAKKLAMV
jgi:serine/threonine protein kinase